MQLRFNLLCALFLLIALLTGVGWIVNVYGYHIPNTRRNMEIGKAADSLNRMKLDSIYHLAMRARFDSVKAPMVEKLDSIMFISSSVWQTRTREELNQQIQDSMRIADSLRLAQQAANDSVPSVVNLWGDVAGSATNPNGAAAPPNGWSVSSGGTPTVDSTIVRTGTTALRISGNASGSYIWSDDFWDLATIGVGDTVKITGYYYVQTPASGQKILFYNSGGSPSVASFNLEQTGNQQWKYFELEYTRQATGFFDIEIQSGNGIFVLDDILLFKVTP